MQTDLWLFIETILSIKGVSEVGTPLSSNGCSVRFFSGLSGRKVMIDCSDDTIYVRTAKDYLAQLGCREYISRLFPPNN